MTSFADVFEPVVAGRTKQMDPLFPSMRAAELGVLRQSVLSQTPTAINRQESGRSQSLARLPKTMRLDDLSPFHGPPFSWPVPRWDNWLIVRALNARSEELSSEVARFFLSVQLAPYDVRRANDLAEKARQDVPKYSWAKRAESIINIL